MERILKLIQRLEETVLSLSILLIAALTITNVIARSVFNTSLASTEELCQFLIVVVTFVGLSYAVGQARHIRMSALYDALGQRSRKILMLIICATTAALMFFVAYHAVEYVLLIKRLGSVSPVLQTPLYLVYAVAPFGFVLAGVRYTAALIRNLQEPDIYLSYTVREQQKEPIKGEI